MNVQASREAGFTIAELVIGLTVMAIVILSVFGLFISLVHSTVIAKKKAAATTLATNQMEYLKSLPYDSLAVVGGSIYIPSPLPATSSTKVNGISYTTTTSINFVDEAFDGCADYPNLQLKMQYCRNYPAPPGAPNPDTNPQDYKIIHVSVADVSGRKLAEVDSTVSARVAETNSTTGALFVSVIDNNGNPVQGATVNISNPTLVPVVALSDSTDSNGISIFYGLNPDTTGNDYLITASKPGYSTLSTLKPAGSLQPNYASQNIFTQLSSYVTLTIKLQGNPSLLIETTDVNGSPLANVKAYVKGGYKKYSDSTDTQYYFDNLSPSDNRPVTDSSGLATINNLVPGDYIFCGDEGATSCSVGGTTYYLVAAVPSVGSNSLNPINVPIFDSSSPPATTFPYGGQNYLQKVRLMLSTFSNFPRVFNISPYEVSLSGGSINNFSFSLAGQNLPCDASPASCSTTVRVTKDTNVYSASCTGDSAGTTVNCTIDLTGISVGVGSISVIANGHTLSLPTSPFLGGINVTP